jgi:hypothetical protein
MLTGEKLQNVILDSFLDGVTGAGLFGKLRRPGAPTVFAGVIPEPEMYSHVEAAKKLLPDFPRSAFEEPKSSDGRAARFSGTKS